MIYSYRVEFVNESADALMVLNRVGGQGWRLHSALSWGPRTYLVIFEKESAGLPRPPK